MIMTHIHDIWNLLGSVKYLSSISNIILEETYLFYIKDLLMNTQWQKLTLKDTSLWIMRPWQGNKEKVDISDYKSSKSICFHYVWWKYVKGNSRYFSVLVSHSDEILVTQLLQWNCSANKKFLSFRGWKNFWKLRLNYWNHISNCK